MADVHYYRIIRNAVPSVDDFRTMKEEGQPLLNPKYRREWEEGVSVYSDLGYALRRARNNETDLGRYVATVIVTDDSGIEVKQTFRPPHHTIYAKGQTVLDLVHGDSVAADHETKHGE